MPSFKVPWLSSEKPTPTPTITTSEDNEEGDDEEVSTMFPAPDSAQRAGSNTTFINKRPPVPTLSVPSLAPPASTFKAPSSSLAPPPSTLNPPRTLMQYSSPASNARVSAARKKVALKPGFSAMDWAALRNSGKNLRGTSHPGILRITPQELSEHKSVDDCWTALGGRVYNMTPYLPFHPGGEKILMAVAGKDGTALFMKTHSWVSFENMLDKCLVGVYCP